MRHHHAPRSLLALPAVAVAQTARRAPMILPRCERPSTPATPSGLPLPTRVTLKGIVKIYDATATVIPPEGDPMTGAANIEKVFARVDRLRE